MATSQLHKLQPSDVSADERERALAAMAQGVDVPVVLPAKVHAVVSDVLRSLGEGQAVTVLGDETYLTPAQAAELLWVSRSYVSRLVRTGRLVSQTVGAHHRIPLKEVSRYRESRRALQDVLDAGEELVDIAP